MWVCSNCHALIDTSLKNCTDCGFVPPVVEQGSSVRGRSRYIRCNTVVGVVLTDIMREYLLRSNIPPRTIYDSIMNNSDFNKNLTPHQMNAIQSLPTQGFSNFDISLMYIIVRYPHFRMIVSDIPTKKKWGGIPDEKDDTIGDNIERIRHLRNDVVHNGQHYLSADEFRNTFLTMLDIGRRSDRHLGKPDRHFERQVEECRCSPIDKELEEKYTRKYKEMKMQWGQNVLTILVDQDVTEVCIDLKKENVYDGKVELKITVTNIDEAAGKAMFITEHIGDIDTEVIKINRVTEGSLVIHATATNTLFLSEECYVREVECFVSSLFRNADLRRVQTEQCYIFVDIDDEPYVDDDLDLQDEENEKKTNLILQVTAEKDSLQSDQRMSQSLNEFMNSLLYRTNGQQLLRSNETYAFVEIDYNDAVSNRGNEGRTEELLCQMSIDDCEEQPVHKDNDNAVAVYTATFESKTSEVTDFLRALGLQHLANVFRTEQISMELLLQMDDKDLYDIGIKKGPRFLILKATADVKYENSLSHQTMRPSIVGMGEESSIVETYEEENECDAKVYSFLKKIQLAYLAKYFAREAINMDVLVELDDAALRLIGIDRLGHRRILISKLKELKENVGYDIIQNVSTISKEHNRNYDSEVKPRHGGKMHNMPRSRSQPTIPNKLLLGDCEGFRWKDVNRKSCSDAKAEWEIDFPSQYGNIVLPHSDERSSDLHVSRASSLQGSKKKTKRQHLHT